MCIGLWALEEPLYIGQTQLRKSRAAVLPPSSGAARQRISTEVRYVPTNSAYSTVQRKSVGWSNRDDDSRTDEGIPRFPTGTQSLNARIFILSSNPARNVVALRVFVS